MRRKLGMVFSIGWIMGLVLISVLGPLLMTLEPSQPVADSLLSPRTHPPLGTDALGRDFFSRVLYGSRWTLVAGSLAAAITVLGGTSLGLAASVSVRWIDRFLIGLINAALAIPGLLFALLLTASMGPGFRTVILAIGFGLVPGYTRLARAIFLQVRQEEFILAARSLGARPISIAFRHILPNGLRGLMSLAALHFSWSLMGITTLTFLGLSGDPSIPELGALLNAGRQYIRTAPHLSLIPGTIISLMVLAVYHISDALD